MKKYVIVGIALISVVIWKLFVNHSSPSPSVTKDNTLPRIAGPGVKSLGNHLRMAASETDGNSSTSVATLEKVTEEPAVTTKQLTQLAIQMRVSRQNAFDDWYGPLYTSLGMTQEQRKQLNDIKVRRLEKVDATIEKLSAGGSRPDKDTVAAVFDVTAKEEEGEFRAAFGDETLSKIKSFDFTHPVRSVVTDLANSLQNGPDELSQEQFAKILEVVGANSLDSNGKVNAKSANVDKIIKELTGSISQSQQDALSAIIARKKVLQPIRLKK